MICKNLYKILLLSILIIPFRAHSSLLVEDYYKAIRVADWPSMEHALRRGIDINIRDEYGYTAIMWASALGKLDIVKKLLWKGASINYRDNTGMSALMLASLTGHYAIAQHLIKKARVPLSYLINHRTYELKETALMIAIKRGHSSIIKLLLYNGASVYSKDYSKNTALILASEKLDNLKTVEVLIEFGSVLNWQNKYGETAFMKASEVGDLDIVKYFFDQGVEDIDEKDNRGETALIKASRNGHFRVVRFLVQNAKANINIKNNLGNTALLVAAHKKRVIVVDYFKDLQKAKKGKENFQVLELRQ